MMMLVCSDIVFDGFVFAFTQLPTLVLFQKLVPDHVEATMMALSASVINLSRGLMGDLMGVFINKTFIGITEKDFEHAEKDTVTDYYKLKMITFVSIVYEFLIIPMIPVKAEINKEIDLRTRKRRDTALGIAIN